MFKLDTKLLITRLINHVMPYGSRNPIYNEDHSITYNKGILLELSLNVKDPSLPFEEREKTEQSATFF